MKGSKFTRSNGKIKIILVDDHINVRRGLCMLSRFPQVDVVAEAGDGIEVLELATTRNLMYVAGCGMPGIKV
jgi:DNA-binding NarL/FixJ family response regulator